MEFINTISGSPGKSVDGLVRVSRLQGDSVIGGEGDSIPTWKTGTQSRDPVTNIPSYSLALGKSGVQPF